MNIEVHLSTQKMYVFDNGLLVKEYFVSTAKNGAGEEYGSQQTPRGLHIIRAKIGTNSPVNAIFVKRRPTGEMYTLEMRAEHPDRDWILTRILWLCGLEKKKNRFGKVDSMKRKIYIHGAPDSVEMGTPGSRGCIRMCNHDVLELFDLVSVGTLVLVKEFA